MRVTLLLAILALSFSAIGRGVPVRVIDSLGNYRYLFVLNEGTAAKESPMGELPARPLRTLENGRDIYDWHRPNVRAMVKRLEGKYSVKAVSMTSWAMPTFTADVSDLTLLRLRQDKDITEVHAIHYLSDLSPWSDRMDGGEKIPWGKPATGTDDSYGTGSFSTPVYMLDASPFSNSDVNIQPSPVYPLWSDTVGMHATHVAGIIAGKMNGAGTRGVIPGLLVRAVHVGADESQLAASFDWILENAEANGWFGVLNFSSSNARYREGQFLARFIRRVSNRLFIVQAAGNSGENACGEAYGPQNNADGIFVVGGTDVYGARATSFDNSQSYIDYAGGHFLSYPNGSNWGPCVEAWAPSQFIYSTWSGVPAPYMNLSGTSMAAPYVAGVAARLGNQWTTPVALEYMVRSRTYNTGYFDPLSLPIRVPSYTQMPSGPVPSKLMVQGVTASTTLSGSDPYSTVDGQYLYGNFWNAGQDGPAWIEFDLGWQRNIRSIRMTPEQWPQGNMTHYIYVGNTPGPGTLAATVSGYGYNLEPWAASFNATARYVQIYSVPPVGGTWVAWREVEIYGN